MSHDGDDVMKVRSDGETATSPVQSGKGVPSDIWDELMTLQSSLDAFTNRLHLHTGEHRSHVVGQPEQSASVAPDVDIYESPQDYLLSIALPGIDPQNIHVQVAPHRILLTAQPSLPVDLGGMPEHETDSQKANEPGKFVMAWQLGPVPPHQYTHLQRSRYSGASRLILEQIVLEEIVPDRAQAHLRHGRLDLLLPKRKPGIKNSVQLVIQVQDQA